MSLNFDAEKKTEHQLILRGREEMKIDGVEEVMGFDDVSVRLRSSEGELYIEGSGIRIGTLDTERKTVALSGRINGIYYASDENKEKRGFFSRILG